MITETINTPTYLSAGLYSVHPLPSFYPPLQLPQFRCRTLNFVLLNCMFFVGANLLMLSFWRTSFAYSMSTASLSLVSFINLVRVSVADRNVSLNIVPCGKQLVISFHMDMEPLVTTLWVKPSSHSLSTKWPINHIHISPIGRQGYCVEQCPMACTHPVR